MHHELYSFIYSFGYPALYLLLSAGIIGLPVPDETLMTFAGSLTAPGGPFLYTTTLMVIYAGTMTGMIVSYSLGHRIGKPFLHRYGKWIKLTPERLEKTEGWFKRYGMWAVFFGYFVPGVRHFTCYLAGVSGVGLLRYLLYAASGALVWCITFLTLGHFIGRNWEELLQIIHKYVGFSVTGIIMIMLIAILVLVRMRKRKKQEDIKKAGPFQ
ncbi:DedA family protein [Paenibacillus sp. GP183]|uniref:DedA family protein n=1 Tax=Paenibacillus sp. GP183 TaxID=1882751 RepID=UPI00089AF316|nr:DedA family protein [Paenibacillus sp. GP183]SEB75101.1 membrane protein DedA, SNARE-associated domain [Paenibacillus sp. GP183]